MDFITHLYGIMVWIWSHVLYPCLHICVFLWIIHKYTYMYIYQHSWKHICTSIWRKAHACIHIQRYIHPCIIHWYTHTSIQAHRRMYMIMKITWLINLLLFSLKNKYWDILLSALFLSSFPYDFLWILNQSESHITNNIFWTFL